MIAFACWALASRSTSESVASPRTVTRPGALGALERRGVLVDDDDVRGRDLVADHRGDRRPALGAVADDDGVVAHSAPPSLDLQCLARLRGERLDGGTDQHDQERDPQRRDHQDVDQPGRRGERGDVAVAGGRQRHRRVVQAVQERQLAFVLHVAVAVAVQVDDEHRREQRQRRVDDAADDPLRRADERFGNAQDVDERGIRSRGQILVDRGEPPSQPTFGHETPSSIRVGARHYVTMTSPPARTAADRQPGTRASRMGGDARRHGRRCTFVAPKPFDTIIPAELPGSPRFYTYASGVAELATGALLLAPRTRKLGALAAVALVRRRCSRPTSTWSGCGGTSR